jgi:hypothetical protein
LTPELRAQLTEHKPGLLRLLAGDVATLTPDEWYMLWSERSAVIEFDGGLSREQAEFSALSDILRCMNCMTMASFRLSPEHSQQMMRAGLFD